MRYAENLKGVRMLVSLAMAQLTVDLPRAGDGARRHGRYNV